MMIGKRKKARIRKRERNGYGNDKKRGRGE